MVEWYGWSVLRQRSMVGRDGKGANRGGRYGEMEVRERGMCPTGTPMKSETLEEPDFFLHRSPPRRSFATPPKEDFFLTASMMYEWAAPNADRAYRQTNSPKWHLQVGKLRVIATRERQC